MADASGTCSFCEQQPARWQYVTPNSIMVTTELGTGQSLTQWKACDACAEAIDAEQWRVLADRVMASLRPRPVTVEDQAEARQVVGFLMTTFRSGRHPVTAKQPVKAA